MSTSNYRLPQLDVPDVNGINLEPIPQPRTSILQGDEAIPSEQEAQNLNTPGGTIVSPVRSRLQLAVTLFALFVRMPQGFNA